jgi:hypothetical protein
VGVVVNAVAWAIIGFDQIEAYQSLGRQITRFDEPRSYNLLHVLLDRGAGRAAAYAVQLLAVAAVAIVAVRLGRRGADRAPLILSVAACLLAAPVIWLHYFALLLVPLGLASRRLQPIWLLPIVLFACPVHDPATWQLVGTLGAAAVVSAWAVTLAARPVTSHSNG